MRWQELFERPIVIVSGKGGTGKSTVAAALALSAASSGRRVLLAEVEGRGEIARTLGISDPGFSEARTPFGFSALSIIPREAATEYLHIYFGMDRLSRPLVRAGVLEQLIGFVPGFRDLLICGKLYEITHVRRASARDRGRPSYDLVVVDAPPTGQIPSFLAAPAAFSELIRVGRMKRQATSIDRMLRGQAAVVLVTLPEEMSVAETVEAVPAIAASGVRIGAIVVNRSHRSILLPGTSRPFRTLKAETFLNVVRGAGLTLTRRQADEALEDARGAEARVREQRRFIASLERAGPLLQLPDLAPGGYASPAERVARLAEAILPPAPGTPAPAVPLPGPAPGIPRHGPQARSPFVPSTQGLDATLEGARIVVVCGPGGVGKTTISAAIAVAVAERGRTTALLTVDPARRLATALRLPTVAGERTSIRLARGRALEAMQLDTQRTFDELIARYAGTPARRDRILSNPFYRRMSNTLAGTHEYMAMEKLYELAVEEQHQAIVIDTPPTRSALSFLDAPKRLTDFLGGRLLRWMLWPSARAGRMTLGVARVGATVFARTAGRLVGAEVLADVADFLSAFEGMYGGFQERATQVLELLRAPDCVFLVVTTLQEGPLDEAGYFVERLAENRMHAGAVLANRSHLPRPALPPQARAAVEVLSAGTPLERAAATALENRLDREPGEQAEAEAMRAFLSRHGEVPVLAVPELAGDVHDVPGLRRVADHLFARANRPAVGRHGRRTTT